MVEDNDENRQLDTSDYSYFAKTLPELFASISSEREMERASIGFGRMNSFS
jgi:hypothetical protein